MRTYSGTNTFTLTANSAPTITLTNAGLASVPVGTPITLNATAADNGSVVSVDFYADGVKVLTRTNAPWTYASSGFAPGAHTNYGVATDNCGLATTSAIVNVTVLGSVIYATDFSTQPTAAQWSFLSVAGANSDITNVAGLDTAVEVLSAASITNQVVADTNNPPNDSASAVWSSTGKYLQTRPTGNKFIALMATLTNNTGADISSWVLGYTFTQLAAVTEEIPGHRVYFSLTGATNSWTNVVGLSSASGGLLATNINATWSNHTVLYLLWADDNGSGSPDTANQIDNVFVSAGMPPAIVTQPLNTLVCPGSTATFTVGVSGSLPLKYQWRKITALSTNNIANATNTLLTLPGVSSSDVAGYSIVVTNTFGSVTGVLATLTLSTNPVVIIAQPQSTADEYGAQTSFLVGIDPAAAQPLSYQWYQVTATNNLLLAGQTQPTLTRGVYETNVANYFAIVGNCINSVTSQLASLSLYYLPLVITNQPQNAVSTVGGSAAFTVGVDGSRPTYQWYKGTTLISGATNTTLTLTNLVPTDSGYYHVEADNPYPSHVVSSSVTLIVPSPSYVIIPLTNTVVIGGVTNGLWKYNQSGIDLGTAWRAVGYNDSSWPSGLGVLAKEDNTAIVPMIHTVLSLTNTSGGTNITFYFRTTFNLTNDPSLTTIITSNLVDDAHVVYVNGVEAYRSTNMPAGTVTYNTLARAAHEENVWEVTTIPSSLLIQGTNTLAVEVHQSAITSSDIVLGLTAMATFPPPTAAPIITDQPANVTVAELKPAAFTVGYIGDAVTLQWFKQHTNDAGADVLPGSIWPTLTITNPVAGVDDGFYFVVLSNLLGTVVSSNALLTILIDTNGPVLQYADGTSAGNVITLTFDERMLAYDTNNPTGSPTNPANYTVTNTFGESLVVTNAQFLYGTTNDTNIVLTTSTSRRTDANYIVTVKSLRDVAPRHNLSTNLACPVSTLLKLINWNDTWTFVQPWLSMGDDVVPFNNIPGNTNWFQSNYVARFDDQPFWANGQAVFYAYYTTVEMADWPAQGIQSINGSGDFSNSYFRLTFNYQASPAGAIAWMRYLVDDGGVFYVNGTEIHRYNMPTGAIAFATSAAASISDPQTQGPTNIALSSLSLGANLMAVELHRYYITNDFDIAFGMEMQARVDSLVTGKVVITTSPSDVTVFQATPANFSFRGVAGSTFQWLSNSVRIAGATSPSYQILSTPLSANGAHYSVIVSNYTGAVTSAPALLTVLSDTNPPVLVSAYLTSSNAITVSFNKPVTLDTATNALNYVLTNALGPNGIITGITLSNGTNVILTVGSFPPGIYTVVVKNVKDQVAGNVIIPNSPVTVGLQNYALVADGVTIWRYNQNNEDLGTGWRAFNYDDSSWSNGLAIFDGKRGGRSVADAAAFPEPIRTTLTLTNQLTPVNDIPTYYFRTKFTAPVLGDGATLSVSYLVDDGAAFYLNGQSLYSIRVNIPTTFGAYGGTTSPSTGNDIPILEGPFNVPITNLVSGTNLLAVELKNVNATSSDASFGTWLYLNVPSKVLKPSTGQGPAITSGPTVTPSTSVFTGQTFTNTVVATGTDPLTYLWRKGGVSLGRTTPSTPFFNVTTNDSGAYDVVITNAYGAITSSIVNVTVKPLPHLFVAATNAHQVVLWWTNSEPFILEATNKVGSASGAWTYVTNNRPYIVPATNAARFYRLKY